ncbi:MAG: cytochrome P460 family protein [Chloroflexota bacterium]
MRDFGFEPPEILGFLRIEDEVTLAVDFTARDTEAPLNQAQTAPHSTVTPTTDLVSDIPSDYREHFFHYTTVNSPDETFRQMYINYEALESIRVDETLPSGAMVIMETYRNSRIGGTLFTREKLTGWGSDEVSEIAIEIRNGEWRYPSFAENDFRRLSADSTSCHACHVQAAGRNYVFTMPDLIEAAQTGITQASECNRVGRQPCDP